MTADYKPYRPPWWIPVVGGLIGGALGGLLVAVIKMIAAASL